jgi:8-oxo-dGTP diphosphatase
MDANPMKIDDIDWPNWNPQQRATLLFVIKDGQILLIHKKRGLGAGKINGPGGRLEPGETPYEAAIRETQEEVGITPTDAVQVGELHFQFVDGLSLFATLMKRSRSGVMSTPFRTRRCGRMTCSGYRFC